MIEVVYSGPLVPAEWIAAHGMHPRCVRPMPRSDSRFGPQTGVCPFARAFAEYAAVPGGQTSCPPRDSLAVFATTCDQMRRIAEFAPNAFVMNVPATWQTPTAERMYAAELHRLSRWLRAHGGSEPCTAAFQQPCGTDFQPVSHLDRVRLGVIGGPIPDDSPFTGWIEEVGGTLVLDGTDGGPRTQPWIDTSRFHDDPIAELTRAYLSVPSIHHRPNHRIFEWLRTHASAARVQGIILRRYVWCDLWHAEARRFGEVLDVPLLDLEVDGNEATDPRVRGRIASFLEMLTPCAAREA